MDRISKALKKLSAEEGEAVKGLLRRIEIKDFKDMDIKKLTGHQDIFRVRKGRIRIIFRITGDSVYLLEVGGRSENTYKDY